MCTDTKTILNRTKLFTDGTPVHLKVPCNHCADCRRIKHDDIFQRIMAEFADCKNHGGKVLFLSLTYNDIHLPRFFYTDEKGNRKSIVAFSSKDKRKFLHDLNQYFHYKGVQIGKMNYPLRCFWACEYGKKTHRPHYHILLYIPKEFLDTYSHDWYQWVALCRRFWSDFPINKGFILISPNRKYRDFVNSDFAALYVSKYVGKDIGFYDDANVQEYMKGVKRSKDDKKYQAIKGFLPGTWKSLQFGSYLTQFYDNYDAFVYGIDFSKVAVLNSKLSQGKSTIKFMPKYIRRKLLYTTDEFGREVYNDKALEWLSRRFDYDVSKDCMRIQSLIDYVDNYIENADIEASDLLSGFGDVESVKEFLNENARYDLRAICYYNRSLSSVSSFRNDDFDSINQLANELQGEKFIQLCRDWYMRKLKLKLADSIQSIYRMEGVFSDPGIRDELKYIRYLSGTKFKRWQLFLDVVQEIHSYQSERRWIELQVQRDERAAAKDMLYKLNTA